MGFIVIVRARYFHKLASYGCSRSQIFSACSCFAQPLFSFPAQEILGQCNTYLACKFDQTIDITVLPADITVLLLQYGSTVISMTRLLFFVRSCPQLNERKRFGKGFLKKVKGSSKLKILGFCKIANFNTL